MVLSLYHLSKFDKHAKKFNISLCLSYVGSYKLMKEKYSIGLVQPFSMRDYSLQLQFEYINLDHHHIRFCSV